MNLSVFTYGFYITINSVMHIISIVHVWRANSHVFVRIRCGDWSGGVYKVGEGVYFGVGSV